MSGLHEVFVSMCGAGGEEEGRGGGGVVVESEHPGSGVGNVTLYVCKCGMAGKYMNESPVETEVILRVKCLSFS